MVVHVQCEREDDLCMTCVLSVDFDSSLVLLLRV